MKEFWGEIRHEIAPHYVKFSRKKKILMKLVWELMIDIVYKFVECKVAGADEITIDKITVLRAIISRYKCDWARHVFNYLGAFVLKAITLGSGVIQGNVGYGFLIAYLLKKKGVKMSEGVKIHSHTYMFKTLIKGTKKKVSNKATEPSESSNAPLTKFLIKRKRVKKVKVVESEESFVDKEPLCKRFSVPSKKLIEKEFAQNIVSTTLEDEGIVKPTEAISSKKIATPPIQEEIESTNPSVQIMNVVEDLRRIEEEEEASTPLHEVVKVDVECV